MYKIDTDNINQELNDVKNMPKEVELTGYSNDK